MILIIGGAYQGKQSYASKTYNLTDPDWKDGQTCTIEDLKTAKAVHHFHSFIRRELDEGGSVRDLAEIIWKENPDLIIVTDEVGYGIVPMDAKDREWREACGRVCTKTCGTCSSGSARLLWDRNTAQVRKGENR